MVQSKQAKPRIGWLGVGNMGTPMVKNLRMAGFEVSVFDIDSDRARAAEAFGAVALPAIEDVAQQCDIVFSMVPNDAAFLDVTIGAGGLAKAMRYGSTYIDMSTVSPKASAQATDIISPLGISFLRSPVSGSTAMAEDARLTVYCSGPRSTFDEARDVLAAFSSQQMYVGVAEEARILKLLINMIISITPAVVGEAIAFGMRSGLDREMMVDAIVNSAAGSPVLGYKAQALKEQDWTPAATLALASKDVAMALDWGKEKHCSLPFLSLAQQFYAAFLASGNGTQDFFAVSTWPERLVVSE